VCGWQSGSLLAQVGRATLLAPGASVHLAAPLVSSRDGQRTSQALVRASAAVTAPGPVETRLPATVQVVAVVVDALARAVPTDLPRVELDGAETGQPTVVVGGHRLHLLYPVRGAHATVTVRVTQAADWRLAGVLGGLGTVDDWLPRVTRPGSGIVVPAQPSAAPVTVRYEAAS
jgi:hypothetical protein